MKTSDKYGVRRFCDYNNTGRCFELYEIHTGKCASFPGTLKDLKQAVKEKNAEELHKVQS